MLRDLSLAELIPKYGSGASVFADVEGARLHYRDEGSGPPLLLIHGTSSSLHTWDAWVHQLPHRRVIRLDLPGFGLTGPVPSKNYGAESRARVALALLTHLGVERADVAGHSLGGRIALLIAADHPERVRRLLLLGADALNGHEPPSIFRLAKVPVLASIIRRVTPRTLVYANVRTAYGNPRRVTPVVVDRYWDLTRREGNRQALIDYIRGPREPNLDKRLREIEVPTLIQWGGKDTWVPIKYAELLCKGLPNAKLIVYPELSHVIMEEEPGRTAADADAFLDETDT